MIVEKSISWVDGGIRFIDPKNSLCSTSGTVDKAFGLESPSEGNHLKVRGSIPTIGKNNKE